MDPQNQSDISTDLQNLDDLANSDAETEVVTEEDNENLSLADAERHLGIALARRSTDTEPPQEELPGYSSGEDPSRWDNSDEKKKAESGEKNIKTAKGVAHFVGPNDTLVGLALRYNVTVEAIRSANRLYTNSIFERGCLLIPVTNYSGPLQDVRSEEDERKALVKRFQITTKCIDTDECWSYMRRFDFVLEKALEEYWSDMRWEKDNPFAGSIPQHPVSHRISAGSNLVKGKERAKGARKDRGSWAQVFKNFSISSF
ncbi:hypothetical protein M427DRAFT_51946 [Gonapodya prolifera JEL478]|uniref:LysM domain-containing protein n=1 Tax=Gonapodya prolifera (strain JEL478) TaxID=1344416 RepID=A0A139AW87_GONPJ|nr:hypothetical protein M427DRAFT_51946 [Gonapodya prolifera JEL478]|eukprot:KXS21002.1 hypothetical protein M427DRAFT_51946 [Gonapodya prolifera JEL478]